MTTTTRQVTDLLVEQHRHIQELFDRVMEAPGRARRQEAFEELRRFIAVHETAEQLVTHPVARAGSLGDAVVDMRLAEEDHCTRQLARLDGLDVEDPEFASLLSRFRVDVTEHAAAEELEEFPLLQATTDETTLARMARALEAVEAIAPTRPHPETGTSAGAKLLTGPVASLVDRTRDAVEHALRS